MFKSIFARYVTAFMLVVLSSFLVIIFIISSIISRYSTEAKLSLMENCAHTAAIYVESLNFNSDEESLNESVAVSRETATEVLGSLAQCSNDTTVLIADASGRIILAVGYEKESVDLSAGVPQSFMNDVSSGNGSAKNELLNGVLAYPSYVCAVPVFSENGEPCGAVLVCARSVMISELLEDLIKGIVVAILWVMLAALIAAYFITERITSPLKDISAAAKQFAEGKFDVRVPVRGNDEVGRLAVAMNNMAESLDNYDTMRNTFMSNVSHDLRSPMTAISGFIDGILDGVIPPEKHEYYLRIVSTEIKRLSRLVASLLDLSRIQAGERKFTMAPFDACEMCREILISFEQKINEKKLEVEFDCPDSALSVMADRDAIYQIVYNLCDNAVKFSSEGGTLRITVKRTKSRKALVSVYNEGQGIAPADLPYVFERFYKSDKSRGLNKSGVGLGLFISKTIIEAHGETIWVESEHERDCEFSFTLPLE